MKKRVLLFVPVIALLVVLLGIQKSPSLAEMTMCGMTADQQFAGFGSDPLFVRKHENPVPLQDYTPRGELIRLETAGGTPANAYFLKSSAPSNDYLIVIHEWWGLNTHIKQESDKLWETLGNINVIALDLYDGKVADNQEDASKYMQAMTTERGRAIVQSAGAYAGADANIFTIGWCFGGGWSLQAAIELGEKAKGCVMFYGMPESDIARLATLKCDVLGLFAANEQWITPTVVAQFEANMKSLGKNMEVKSYPAEHGFANPSNPKFDRIATEDAYQKVYAFIKARR